MNSETQTNSPSNFRRNLVIALGVLWVTLPPLMGFWLLGELGTVGDWLKSQPDFGLLIFVGIFALTSGFGLLPTDPCAIFPRLYFYGEGGDCSINPAFLSARIDTDRMMSRAIMKLINPAAIHPHPVSANSC